MNKKEVFAWGMYDLANTAFSALFVTFFYPLYIKSFLGGNEFHIGLVFGLSMFLVGIIVPVIGALSDRIGRRMPFIVLFTFLCCVFTFLIIYVNLFAALLFGLLANFFYHAALTTYNALLPKLCESKDMGKVSGFGTGLGYVGTLLSLFMAIIILNNLGWESIQGVKAIFPATALFFFIFSIATFIGIREKRQRKNSLWKDLLHSISEVKSTLAGVRKNKSLLYFILSMFLYADAINAVIVFLYLYGSSEINLSMQSFMIVYIIFSIAAAIGSLAFGIVVDKIGAKKSLSIAGILWVLIILLLVNVKSYFTFLIGGITGGVALGIVWTAMRPLLVELSPRKKMGQFFGFLELTGKFSGVLGPIVFGYMVVSFGYKAALVSLLFFFASGFAVLQKVREKR